MRFAVPVALAALASACGDNRFGAYLIVDGSNPPIKFSRAELFFGSPITGAFATPSGPLDGQVYERQVAPSDLVLMPRPASVTATYYVPPGSENSLLGAYVLALAYDANDVPVGIGELSGFTVATDYVEKAFITLERYDSTAVQQWGSDPSCVSWRRPRGLNASSQLAVVRADDRDCDDRTVDEECNDLEFCPTGDLSCDPHVRCGMGTTVNGCELGCGSACTSSVCIPFEACDASTNCVINDTGATMDCFPQSHLSIEVPTYFATATIDFPCTLKVPFDAPSNAPCIGAQLVYAEILNGYHFTVDDDGVHCYANIIPPPTKQPYTGDHHLAISIDTPGGGPRKTFVVGIEGVHFNTCTNHLPAPRANTSSIFFDCN